MQSQPFTDATIRVKATERAQRRGIEKSEEINENNLKLMKEESLGVGDGDGGRLHDFTGQTDIGEDIDTQDGLLVLIGRLQHDVILA